MEVGDQAQLPGPGIPGGPGRPGRPAPRRPDDARLTRAAAAGDRAAFAAIYDRHADRLHDYCLSLLRNRAEAADATQDTFTLAAERLGQLRDPARLRPWLYAVARGQALRRLRDRARLDPEADTTGPADPGRGPREAERADLRVLVWNAAAGLSERDRSVLDLHLRHGLEGSELGEAMGVGANHAYVLLSRVRDQVERALGALLVARLGRDDCPDLNQLLAGWDGRFSPLIRKRVARHVDSCDSCGERRRTVVSPTALLAGVPLFAAPPELRERVLAGVRLPGESPARGGRTGRVATRAPAAPAPPVPVPQGRRADRSRQRRRMAVSSGLVAVVAALIGAGISYSSQDAEPRPAAAPPAAAPFTSPTSAPGATSTDPTTSTAGAAIIPSTATVAAVAPATVSTTPGTQTPAPALLAVAPAQLTLTPQAPSGAITLRNTGGRGLSWSATTSLDSVTVAATGGTLGPGEATTATVTAQQRLFARKVPTRATVTVSSDAGSSSVAVTVAVDQGTTTTTTSTTTTTLATPGSTTSTSTVGSRSGS